MYLNTLSEKILISLGYIEENEPVSDQMRIERVMKEKGYENIVFPLKTLRKLYPLTRPETGESREYTVSLVHKEEKCIMTAGGEKAIWREVVVTDVEEGDTRGSHYGIAVDYGSTTVLFQLMNLNTGESVYICREVNLQRQFGADILTRIIHGLGGPDQRRELHDVTAETFRNGFQNIQKHTGIDPRSCPAMVISGNTTMIHFLLELDAWTVFSSPYAPVTTNPGFHSGEELRLDFPGQVYIMPSASNYIGGDIISGLLTIDLHKKEEIGVFFDIGTNGELVLGNKEFLIAGAGAAGPALEGDISKYGTLAKTGAIDTVTIEGRKLYYTTIGQKNPLGICGSGIIDLLAQMRLNGWIDIAGKLDPAASDRITLRYNEEKQTEELVVVYAWADESALGEDLYFSQTDIEQYIETKAAAHIMIDCLLEAAGITEEEIGHMYLSGAFCNYANLESAVTIGMFPDLDRSKYTVLPNSSLEGAGTLLLDRSRLEDIRMLMEQIYCVQFASMPDFMILMQAAKFIPHTDMTRYPSVAKRLQEMNRVKFQ